MSQSGFWRRPMVLGVCLGVCLVSLGLNFEDNAQAQDEQTLSAISAGALPTKTIVLPNGMKVVLYQDANAEQSTLSFVHRAGIAREWQGLMGAAHVAGALMTAGTNTVGTKNYGQERRILSEMDRLDQAVRAAQHILQTSSGDPDGEQAAFDQLNQSRTAFQDASQRLEKLLQPEGWANAYQRFGGGLPQVSVRHDGILYTASVSNAALGDALRLENTRLQNHVSHSFYQVRGRLAREWEGEWNSEAAYPLWEAFADGIFTHHPYGHFRGTSEQLLALSRGELDYFMDLFTDPSRTVLAIVGPTPIKEVERLVRRSLTTSGRPPAGPLEGEELPQRGERRLLVRRTGEAELLVAYHQKKPWDPRERAAMVILADLLSHSEDGLLLGVMEAAGQSVDPSNVAAALYPQAGPAGPEDPAALVLGVTVPDPGKLCLVESSLFMALAQLAELGPPEAVFDAAKERLSGGITQLETEPQALASALAWTTLTHGSPEALALHRAAILEVKSKDIKAAAMAIFNPNNRTVAVGWPSSYPGSLAACTP